jgi:TM2 domain-containing membrane protein YozV
MKQHSIIFFLFLSSLLSYGNRVKALFIDSTGIVAHKDVVELKPNGLFDKNPSPILKFLHKKQRNNRKITAAILAFPFPFGIVGLHRIYLGTKPYVPVAYIGTLGGIFGIIPLIDFCAILFNKEITQFENNGKVLMWVK